MNYENSAAFRTRVETAFDFDEAELAIVDVICRLMDQGAALRRQAEGLDMITTGSTGQMVVAPFVAEIRQTEAEISRQIRNLGIGESQ